MLILIIAFFYIALIYLFFSYFNNKKKISNKSFVIIIILFIIIITLLNCLIINVIYNYKNNTISKEQENSLKETITNIDEEELNYEIEKEELLEIMNDSNYDTIKGEIEQYLKENQEYKDKVETLKKDYNSLLKDITELKKDYDELLLESEFLIPNFPTYNQFPNYPNGCESVALYLLLKYNGVNVTVEDIVEKLKKGDTPHYENGIYYGGDPDIEFVGDPRSKYGYGVYEGPIIDVANYFKPGIKNITGSSLSNVLSIVRSGIPVQVWASINMQNTKVCSTWTHKASGKKVNWICRLHSLVIIGTNYDKVITSDPYTGEIVYYDKTQFEKMYNTFGKRALYYEKEN